MSWGLEMSSELSPWIDLLLNRRTFLSGAAVTGAASLLSALPQGADAQGQGQPASGVAAPPDTQEQRLSDLVTANHILFDQGIVDGLGHVSVRSLKDPSHFFVSRSLAPGLTTLDDILEFDQDTKPVNARGRQAYLESFIHGEIFRARPDVHAVVHAHTPAVVAFASTDVPLRPILHMMDFMRETPPVFILPPGKGVAYGILVDSNARGASLAKTLGSSIVVLMRNHGFTVVGPNIASAVSRAHYMIVNAQIALDALKLGKPTFLDVPEAKGGVAGTEGPDRGYPLWAARADAAAALVQNFINKKA